MLIRAAIYWNTWNYCRKLLIILFVYILDQIFLNVEMCFVVYQFVNIPILWIWNNTQNFFDSSSNFFWGVLIVEIHPLGSGGCFGTILDHLGWIRSILRQIKKIMFETSFYLIFAAKFLNGMVLTCNVKKSCLSTKRTMPL